MDGISPFVSDVKYPDVIFYKRIAWRLHKEKIAAKTFRAFIRFYFLFKTKLLSVNVKLTPIKH
jgi:hypothetical protein